MSQQTFRLCVQSGIVASFLGYNPNQVNFTFKYESIDIKPQRTAALNLLGLNVPTPTDYELYVDIELPAPPAQVTISGSLAQFFAQSPDFTRQPAFSLIFFPDPDWVYQPEVAQQPEPTPRNPWIPTEAA